MKKFTDIEIEEFYLETMSGFYLKGCAKNSKDDEDEEFYQNQLGEFREGFKCAMDKAR